jgi:hypothetical protein
MGVRVMVTGSRDWEERSIIRSALAIHLPPGGVLVHGAARGADLIAAEIADSMGREVEAHHADWDTYGRGAGYRRNVDMLISGIDLVLAFHKDNSRGTAHAIREAKTRLIPVVAYVVHGSYPHAQLEVWEPKS